MWNLGTLAQFQGSEISPGLLQDFTDGYIKFLRLPTIISSTAVPHQGATTQHGPNQWFSDYNFRLLARGPSSNPMSSQFSIKHMPSFTFSPPYF